MFHVVVRCQNVGCVIVNATRQVYNVLISVVVQTAGTRKVILIATIHHLIARVVILC